MQECVFVISKVLQQWVKIVVKRSDFIQVNLRRMVSGTDMLFCSNQDQPTPDLFPGISNFLLDLCLNECLHALGSSRVLTENLFS